MKTCITSVGCRDPYVKYLDRLESSLKCWNPNVPRLFYRECWPPGSPGHQHSHYAFKVHAIRSLYWASFNIAIWLDAGCEVIGDLTPIIETIRKCGYYIVAGTEPLGEWVSDQALERYGVTRDEAMDLNLCGGAIVGINFDKPDVLGYQFLMEWMGLSEEGYFFTSHSEHRPDRMRSLMVSDANPAIIHSEDQRFKGHRADEACFSLMLHKRGLTPFSVKQYFTSQDEPNPKAIIKSGYDLA